MSSEERQRIVREAGFRPAEAEKESKAEEGKHAKDREDPASEVDDRERDRPRPLPEDETGPPRPRR
jgi:hypothetical protein